MIDSFFRRLTVRQRITGGFLFLIMLLLLSIPFFVASRNFLIDRLQVITDAEQTNRLLLLASTRIASSRVNLTRYVQDYAPSTFEAVDDVEQATKLLTQVQNLAVTPEQKDGVALVLNALADYRNLIGQIEAARQSGDSHAVTRLQFQAFRLGNDIGQRIELIVQDSEAQVRSVNQTVQTDTQQRLTLFVTILVGGAALALVLSVLVTRSITRPVAELRQGAEAFRQGQMDIQVPVTGDDELSLLAQTFNQVTTSLSALYRELEDRVADRTRRLELMAELSGRLAAILNLDDLLAEVVNQIKESFGYYHAHIYLLDESRNQLVVAAGTGPAGEEMKARGHSIALNAVTSLVARSARNMEVVTVDNVRQADDWLPNPLLPDTYSEMAVPIVLENRVVGVLDVQQNRIAGLDEGDATLLRSLAGQVAVAIRNARLFAETQATLAETREAQRRYLEQAWQKTKIGPQRSRHLFAQAGAAPPTDELHQTMEQTRREALAKNRPAVVTINGDGPPAKSLAAPINLHNTTVGVVQLHAAGNNAPDWTEDDLAVVEAVLDQLAQTAENLRLFEETRERAGREQTLREITDKLRAAPNLDLLLETAARELGQRLGVRNTVLELGIDKAPQ